MPEVLWLNEKPLEDWMDAYGGVYGVYNLDTSWWPSISKNDFLRLIDILTNDEVEWTKELEEAWVKKGIPRSVLEGRDNEIGGQDNHWNEIWNMWEQWRPDLNFYIPRYSDDFEHHGWPDEDDTAKVRRGDPNELGNTYVYIPKGLYENITDSFVIRHDTINQDNVGKILSEWDALKKWHVTGD